MRFVKMKVWYGIEVSSIEDDAENCEHLISEGNVVIYAEDVEQFCDTLYLNEKDVTIVEPDN